MNERILPDHNKDKKTVTELDLSVNQIKEPLNSYRVREGHYIIAQYSKERPWLITVGLSACKAVVIYNHKEKKGLVVHLNTHKNIKKTLEKTLNEFGGINNCEITVVHGLNQANNSNWLYEWPTLEKITETLHSLGGENIRLDKTSGRIRGIGLNLENGNIKEIDGSKGWSWSDQQNTKDNKRLV